ncbi:autophagy-related protein 17 [Flagelloscypha sp. PMI_526]|nr:autophagy-related protein 17 [Flagelloscypha sp. PMI_526]
MAAPSSSSQDVLSLVLQSEKALQQGEQLCQQAASLSSSTSQCSIDVLALDAKVRWMADAVLDQLEVARGIARYIQEKRAAISLQIQDWDDLRARHTTDLEGVLESLSGQFVPPSFHREKEEEEVSPFALPSSVKLNDKSTWKNLRDFVDDNAIEHVLDTIDSERNTLSDIFDTTEDYDLTLARTIDMVRSSIEPVGRASDLVRTIESTIMKQDDVKNGMAERLESLARHYEGMAEASRDAEAGEEFGEEDLNEMLRDTEELPAIIAELEDSVSSITDSSNVLTTKRSEFACRIDNMKATIDDLDELGDIMADMLATQDNIQGQCHHHLTTLHAHLTTLSSLHDSYSAYQLSYSKLVLELARRRAYTDAAGGIVRGMLQQLTAMTLEETRMRTHFTEDYGANIPDDICLCIGDLPTRWNILPDSKDHGLPDVPVGVLSEAKGIIAKAELEGSVAGGMDSF